MKRLYRFVLRHLRPYLVENLLVDGPVFDELISFSGLDIPEAEIVKHEKCNRDKINRVLIALSSKSDEVYDEFKRCLVRTKNEHVLEEIQKEEKKYAKEADLHDENTKQVLLGNIVADNSSSCISLEDIRDILLNEYSLRNTKGVEDILDDDWLKEQIINIFPDSKSDISVQKPSRKKSGKSYQKLDVFYGLSLKLPEDQHYVRRRQESESSNACETEFGQVTEHQEKGTIKVLSIEELNLWLKEVLSKHCGDSSAAEKLKEDQIDGSVFNVLSKDDMEKYFPIFGQRKKVEIMWKELKENNQISKATQPKEVEFHRSHDKITNERSIRRYEVPRPFDCQDLMKYSYYHGSFLKHTDTRRGNPLTPVHKFLKVQRNKITNSQEANILAAEVVQFGSACMNDKINGTLHIGISSEGEIIGCKVDKKLIERKITQTIRNLFYDGQVSTALNCIRPPQFVLVNGQDETAVLFVIEVDVVSSVRFVEDQAFFLKGGSEKTQECQLFRYIDDPKLINPREVERFMKDEKQKLFENRKEFEDQHYRRDSENGFTKLKDFLCCGNDTFEPSVYPLLISQNHDISDNQHFDFIRHVDWRAIFDFKSFDITDSVRDYLDTTYGIVFNVNFVEDFDTSKVHENRVKQTLENLKSSGSPNWIYCNGPTEHLPFLCDPGRWKMERRNSFRKAVEFYSENIPQNRGRILIPLFKEADELDVEAVEELFVKFACNCLILSENEKFATKLKDALKDRNVFQAGANIDNFFLVGLPWPQLSEALGRLVKKSVRVEGLELQRSTEVPMTVPLTFRRELCDLDILFMNECQEIDRMSSEEKECLKREHGEEFYRGNAVSWPNFYFADQVLQRDISKDLDEKVLNAVKGDGNFSQPVKKVVIYHQHGAGGSTTAKNAIWSMRKKHRCCVVKNFTRQTTDQINRLRTYGEEDRNRIKPVILLVDLADDEIVARLHDELENESQKHSCEVFCVMLVCCRVIDMPTVSKVKQNVFLAQNLTPRELSWFQEKYTNLAIQHKENKGCHPETLLSLNIMKENFNMENIRRYISKYIDDPQLTKEQIRLLKYLSFLNYFDVKFQPVPKNSFDSIMGSLDWIRRIPQAMRILMNPVSVNGLSGQIPCLRITNHLLALPIMESTLAKSEGFKLTIGELSKQLLNSAMINPMSRADFNKKFERILGDIVKKRSFSHTEGKTKPFSLLVSTLFEAKDYDNTIEIIGKIYEITDDPLVAQQLTRFHAEIGNWDAAYQTIEMAMEQLHNSPYLNHTCGHVYKMQFTSLCKDKNLKNTEETSLHTLQVAQSSRHYFREAQRLSKEENISPQNPSGLDGEIRLSIDVLKTFSIPDVIKECEKSNHVIPKTRYSMNDCPCSFIKSIEDSTLQAIEVLQTVLYRTPLNNINWHGDYFASLAENLLQFYRREFSKYLHKSLKKPKRKCEVVSYIDALSATAEQLREAISPLDSLNSKSMSLQTVRVSIASILELILRRENPIPYPPENLLLNSRKFYERLTSYRGIVSPTCRLEAHFMLIALHWSLETKKHLREKLIPFSVFISTLESWKTLADDKQNRTNIDKMICYLSNDSRFPNLVKSQHASKNNLLVIPGTLCSNGTEVEITPHAFLTDKTPTIRIQTLYPIRISSMWNKKVNVIVGFGLYGPKVELLDNVLGSISPRYQIATKSKAVSDKSHVYKAAQSIQYIQENSSDAALTKASNAGGTSRQNTPPKKSQQKQLTTQQNRSNNKTTGNIDGSLIQPSVVQPYPALVSQSSVPHYQHQGNVLSRVPNPQLSMPPPTLQLSPRILIRTPDSYGLMYPPLPVPSRPNLAGRYPGNTNTSNQQRNPQRNQNGEG